MRLTTSRLVPSFACGHLMDGGVGLPLEQARSQPLVDPLESHVVNEGHQVREPLGRALNTKTRNGGDSRTISTNTRRGTAPGRG